MSAVRDRRSALGRSGVLALALALCAIAGCATSTAAHRDGAAAHTEAVVASIDEELDRFDPSLLVTPLEAGQWALELEIASPGDATALAAAARRIAWVSFVVYRPGAHRIDSLVGRDVAIAAGGVRGPGSPVVYAGAKWVQKGLAEGDEYVMMTIRTDRGVVVRSSPLFAEPPRGYDSTRLALRLVVGDDWLGLVARRRLAPAREEFVIGSGTVRMTMRDSTGAIVWSASDGAAGALPRPVLPDRIGDSLFVRFAFDGLDRHTGRDLAPGRYTLSGEVAVRPRPYFIDEEIRRGGR